MVRLIRAAVTGASRSSTRPRSTARSPTSVLSGSARAVSAGRSSSRRSSASTRSERRAEVRGLKSRPDHIKEVADASLQRLRVIASISSTGTASSERANRDVAGAVKDLIQAGRSRIRPLGGGRADDPARARGAAGHRGAERGLVVDRQHEQTSSRDRGWASVRAVQPAGQGLPHRRDRRQTTLVSTDFRSTLPRFTPKRAPQPDGGRPAGGRRKTQERRPRRSRWRGFWPRSPDGATPGRRSCIASTENRRALDGLRDTALPRDLRTAEQHVGARRAQLSDAEWQDAAPDAAAGRRDRRRRTSPPRTGSSTYQRGWLIPAS